MYWLALLVPITQTSQRLSSHLQQLVRVTVMPELVAACRQPLQLVRALWPSSPVSGTALRRHTGKASLGHESLRF